MMRPSSPSQPVRKPVSMQRKKPRSSTPASCRYAWVLACYAPRPRVSRPSPRSALCGEISRNQLGEARIAVVARDVECRAPAPGALVQVDASRRDIELGGKLVVALHRIEELALIVV